MSAFHPYLTLKLNVMKDVKKLNSELKDVILKFLFTFNIFESEFFEEPKSDDSESNKKSEYKRVSQRENEIQNICNENNYPVSILEKFQSHFCEVYLDNNEWSDRFRSLKYSNHNKNGFNENDMEHIYDFLNCSLENNKRFAIKNALMISYKFRNNLFHGNKEIQDLKDFKDDFIEITNFLILLMEYLDKIEAKQF